MQDCCWRPRYAQCVPINGERSVTWAKDVTNVTGWMQKTNKIGNSLYPSQGWTFDNEFNYYFWTSDSFSPAGGDTGLAKGPLPH